MKEELRASSVSIACIVPHIEDLAKLSFSYHSPGQFRLRQSPLEVLQSIRIEFVMIACSRTVSEQEFRAWNREVSNPGFCDEAVRKSRHA